MILSIGRLRPAVDAAIPWDTVALVGVPFLVALALILVCRDVSEAPR